MIDVALRDIQFSRVLGFLDEQLGDNDVAIVFGDADSERVYFVSNRPLAGYKMVGGIYVKDDGQPEEWGEKKLSGIRRIVNYPHHTNIVLEDFRRETMGLESGLAGAYGWSHSKQFKELIAGEAEDGWHLQFPEDFAVCHEGAHCVISADQPYLFTYPMTQILLEDALAHKVSYDYMSIFYPCQLSNLTAKMADAVNDNIPLTGQAFEIVLRHMPYLQEMQQQIKKRNQARKATERHT